MKLTRTNRIYDLLRNKDGSLNWLKLAAITSLLICVCIQVYYVIAYWEKPQMSDALIYLNHASHCVANNEFYPSLDNLHDPYLFAPGFVNYVILQIMVFGTERYNMILNILLSIGIAYEIYYLGKRLFNNATALWSVIIYSLLYSTWQSSYPLATEVPFIFLVLAAICLSLKANTMSVVLCGICLGLANTIRPLVIVAIPTILLLMWHAKCKKTNYLYLFASLFVVVAAMGCFVYNKTGIFAPQSTTSGINLLMTSHDNAKGNNITNDPALFIDNSHQYTFAQKDSIYKSRAINWIKQNPVKYAKLYAFKLCGLYSHDTGYDGFYEKTVGYGDYKGDNYFTVLLKKAQKSIVYYLALIVFVITLIIEHRDIASPKGYLLIMLVIGTLITCLFSTHTRYHIPFLFIIILWAAYGLSKFFNKKNSTPSQTIP